MKRLSFVLWDTTAEIPNLSNPCMHLPHYSPPYHRSKTVSIELTCSSKYWPCAFLISSALHHKCVQCNRWVLPTNCFFCMYLQQQFRWLAMCAIIAPAPWNGVPQTYSFSPGQYGNFQLISCGSIGNSFHLQVLPCLCNENGVKHPSGLRSYSHVTTFTVACHDANIATLPQSQNTGTFKYPRPKSEIHHVSSSPHFEFSVSKLITKRRFWLCRGM